MSYQGAFNKIVAILEHELSPLLTYHNLDHAKRVLSFLDAHLETLNLDLRKAELLRLAAIGHDIGFTEIYDGHEVRSIEIVRSICEAEGYLDSEIEQISNLIMTTNISIEPRTFMEKMLVDADLEYLGSDDCMLILERLYQEWINYKLIPADYNKFLENSLQFMEAHSYETDFAKLRSNKSKNIKILQKVLDLD